MEDDYNDSYESALDTAAAFFLNLDPGAQADARILVVTEVGAVQIIGTGARWPNNTQMVVDGPSMLVYKKDAEARAAELRAESQGG